MLEVIHIVEVLLCVFNFLLQINILLSKINVFVASHVHLLDLFSAHAGPPLLDELLALVEQVGAVLGLLALLLELVLLLFEVCVFERGFVDGVRGCVVARALVLHLFLLLAKVGIGLLAETPIVLIDVVVLFV